MSVLISLCRVEKHNREKKFHSHAFKKDYQRAQSEWKEILQTPF